MSVPTASDSNPAHASRRGPGLLVWTAIALVLRVAFILMEPPSRLAGDEFTWTGWAWGETEGLTSDRVAFSPFRSEMIFYPPLYPYFLAASRVLLGSLTAVKLLQALLSALLVPAVGRIGTLTLGRRAGLIAAAGVALYPELIWYAAHFWSETLFLTLAWWAFERLLASDALAAAGPWPSGRLAAWLRGSLLSVAALGAARLVWGRDFESIAGALLLLLTLAGALGLWYLLARNSAARDMAAVAGSLWGIAILARETLLYFAPVAALWLLWRRRDGLARAAVFLIPLVLVVAPWTYRNYVVTRAFVPVATSGALNLWQGNTPLAREQVYALSEAVRGPGHVRIAQQRYHQRMAWDAIWARQPAWLAEKLVSEMPAFWEADSLVLIHLTAKRAYGECRPATARAVAALVLLPYVGLLALAVAGALRLRMARAMLLLLSFLVYHNLIHVATHGFSRYRLPVLPILLIIAAASLVRVGAGLTPTPWRRVCVGCVALVLALSLLPSLGRLSADPVFRQPAAQAGAPPGVRR